MAIFVLILNTRPIRARSLASTGSRDTRSIRVGLPCRYRRINEQSNDIGTRHPYIRSERSISRQ
ncbi:hypothetical protein FCJ61_29535 [Burkholderia metallica]|nr:hypothetical protein [Burkholderia metallica]